MSEGSSISVPTTMTADTELNTPITEAAPISLVSAQSISSKGRRSANAEQVLGVVKTSGLREGMLALADKKIGPVKGAEEVTHTDTPYYNQKVENRMKNRPQIDDPAYHQMLGEEYIQAKAEAKRNDEVFDEAKQEEVERRVMKKYMRRKDAEGDTSSGEKNERNEKSSEKSENPVSDESSIDSEMRQELRDIKMRQELMEEMMKYAMNQANKRELPPEYKELLELVKKMIEGTEPEKGKKNNINSILMLIVAVLLMIGEPVAKSVAESDRKAA